ncbi:MAG: hypothetical protein ACE37B_10685 [Ilumatobacter sp.]|jgi:hypothetical protein|uniref:hypothetical protein n=1 Tax=Ilumatobacter sp. TaxID=1967498 RepID=UPI00391D04CB
MNVTRGDGVGIEVADSYIRAVRLRHDTPGRVAAAAELPFVSYDDSAALDSFVLLRAELGDPVEPTRMATFPASATLQRIDVTGRSGPELNELRAVVDRRHGIDSTLVMDEGPRRWLLLIRWEALAIRRLEDLAERAGFVDVTVEPSPVALARVVPSNTSYLQRFVAQGDAHHAVVRNGLPVAAVGMHSTGRTAPDITTSNVDVPVAWFDDLLTEDQLTEMVSRVSRTAEAASLLDHVDGTSARATTSSGMTSLGVAGDAYPLFPVHDLRAAQRQGVALGAAAGAAGLAGTLRPVDMNAAVAASVQQFDRPWAIERLSDLPDLPDAPSAGTLKRVTKRLRPRKHR